MALRRPTQPRIRPHGDLRGDEVGSFVVLEAILVALLVLTAILFFTSVQRPSTGTDQGGIDLGQVAADTLSILEVREIEGETFEEWITAAAGGDATIIADVQEFLSEVLPTGARYAVRLDNGVSHLTIVSSGTGDPHAARGAKVMVLPEWAAYQAFTVGNGLTVSPGEVVATTHALVSGTYACFQAPNGYTTAPDGPDADTAADTWASRWAANPVPESDDSVPWKDPSDADALNGMEQIPIDLPLGRWKVSTGAASGTPPACPTATATYVDVVRPGYRSAAASTSLTLPSTSVLTLTGGDVFMEDDVGRAITGVNLAANARITAVTSATTATFEPDILVGSTGTVTLSPDSSFLPYGVQLVVWFGA